MENTKCLCGKTIPVEQHTGRCQLDHFISYTGNGKHGFDFEELLRIVDVIESEAKSAPSVAQAV